MNSPAHGPARHRRAGCAALALLALVACGGSDGDDDDRRPANANGALTSAQINAAQAALDRPLEVDTPADPGLIDAAQAAIDSAEADLGPGG